MSDIFNDDFRDFIDALNNNKVEYIVVGGYAVILYGYRRPTGDMDIWVNKTKENYSKLTKAFKKFGLSVFDMTEEKFLSVENEFALKEGILLNTYFFLKNLGQSDERAFGLEKSDVVIEQVPLIYQPVQNIELVRNEKMQ